MYSDDDDDDDDDDHDDYDDTSLSRGHRRARVCELLADPCSEERSAWPPWI